MTERKNFPKILTAVRQADRSAWEIADAVLEEVGPPGEHGQRDGTLQLFDRCSEFLAERGYSYHPTTLRKMRGVAVMFPKRERKGISFSAAREIRSPAMLREYMEGQNGASKPPSEKQAKAFIQVKLGTSRSAPHKRSKREPWLQFLDCVQEASAAAKRALALYDVHNFDHDDVKGAVSEALADWVAIRRKASAKELAK